MTPSCVELPITGAVLRYRPAPQPVVAAEKTVSVKEVHSPVTYKLLLVDCEQATQADVLVL